MYRFYCILLLILLSSFIHAQIADTSGKENKQSNFSISPTAGFVIVHTPTVANTRGTKTAGFSLQFATQIKSKYVYDKCGCYPQNGIDLNYFHFTKNLLGDGFALAYFLQPVIKINDRWQFQFKGAAGLSYLTKPDDSIVNLANRNYSTHLNSYLDVGTGFGYLINNHLLLQANADIQHVSNGAFKHPNAGINWVSGSLSMVYYPDDDRLPVYKRAKSKDWKNKKPWFDIGFYYVPSQGYYFTWQAKRNYVAGGYVQVAKQISPVDDINFSMETYYNNISILESDTVYNHNKTSFIAGIAAGHDFIFGKVFFSQQFGMYVTQRPSYYPAVYQRYGLAYRFTKHFLAGINLKVHGDEADFIDMRVVYRF